jgi:DNA-binding NtrC family response regulator
LTGGIPVIVISCIADWEAYMKAISAGAFDYIAFPPDPVESERILRLALDYNSQPQPVTRLAHGPMSDSQPPYHPQNRI